MALLCRFYYAILKTLHNFKVVRAHEARDMLFPFKIFKCSKCLKTTKFTRAAC